MAPKSLHIGDLKPDPKNPRIHGSRNIGQIAYSLQTFGPARSIAIDENNVVLAGNGVVEAAQQIGVEYVRVYDRASGVLSDPPAEGEDYIFAVRISGLTEKEKRQYAVADNRTAELAEWDTEILEALAAEGVELTDWWFDDELDVLLGDPDEFDGGGEGDGENPYTQKIDTPIYTPTMDEPPALNDLYDTGKRDALVAVIETTALPEEVRAFLLTAAERHVVFDYRNIAEYYAHAAPDVQALMEESALVIIDAEKAIEYGYVRARDRFLSMIGDHREG